MEPKTLLPLTSENTDWDYIYNAPNNSVLYWSVSTSSATVTNDNTTTIVSNNSTLLPNNSYQNEYTFLPVIDDYIKKALSIALKDIDIEVDDFIDMNDNQKEKIIRLLKLNKLK